MDVSGGQMILGLVIGIAVLILLVLKTKIHAFIALIIAASITGIVGGMNPSDVVTEITEGFGSTLGSIGIVIGFGVMMGKILETSGAAEKLAYSLIKTLGKKKEERSEEHTSELQSRFDLVCRLLLEKKNQQSHYREEH